MTEMSSIPKKLVLGAFKPLKTVQLLCIILFLGLNQGFAQNYGTGPAPLNECPKKDGVIRYALGNTQNNSHGLYFLEYYGDDRFATWEFQAGSYMDFHANGDIVLKGIARTSKNQGPGGDWKVEMYFKFVPDNIFKFFYNDPPVSTDDWRNYKFLAERSKMYKVGDKNDKVLFRRLARTQRDGGVGEYPLQVGNQAALISKGYEPGVFGASTWFEYSIDHGKTWRQGDINVLLYHKECKEVKPVKFEGICSTDYSKNFWKVTNHNNYKVQLYYETKSGKRIPVIVDRAKNGKPGMKVFKTSVTVEEITLKYSSAEKLGSLTAKANIEPCDLKPICDKKFQTYKLSSYANNGHSIWLKNFKGQTRRLHFGEEAIVVYQKANMGGFLHAEIESELLGEKGWTVFVKFEEVSNHLKPKFEKGGKDPESGKTQQQLSKEWKYLKLKKGYIKNRNGSKVIELCALNNNYGFQVGTGANGKNWEFGASTWFEWKFMGEKNQGDFNLNLVDVCKDIKPINPKIVCNKKYETFVLSSYADNGHSIWLKNFKGQTRSLHFGQKAYLVYEKGFKSGTLKAEIKTELLGEKGWKVYAEFEQAPGNVKAKYEKGGKNADDKTQKDLAKDWKYLRFKKGYIKSRNGKKIIELCALDNNYGFQIGYSANGKNWEFGASTWFEWKYCGDKNQGDFNLNLRNICEDIRPKVVCNKHYGTYALHSYAGNGHSIWLKGFEGKNRELHFGDKAFLVYKKDYSKGTLKAEIKTELLGEKGWKVFAEFVEAPNDVKAKYEKGGKNAQGDDQKELAKKWKYLLFKSGYIKNKDGSKIIDLCALANNYGFQIGYSANGKNWEFGASTWFEWKFDGKKNQGDFNLNLKNKCIKDINPKKVCNDKQSTYALCSYAGNGHSIWLKGFKGKNRELHFGDKAFLVYHKDYSRGTLRAEIDTEILGRKGWKVYAEFVKAPGNVRPKYEKGGTDPNMKMTQQEWEVEWEYLLFKKGYIVSADKNEVIELCALDNNYGFQIGIGANGKNWEFGASTWFEWKFDGMKNKGDFNLNLKKVCEDKEEKCDFTITMDNERVGNCTRITLCEKKYCGPAWYKLTDPENGDTHEYKVQVINGQVRTCEGFDCLKSGKTYIMYLRTKKKVYEPIRFIKG